MPQLSEAEAEMFSPGQAAALVRILDLQAHWDALLDGEVGGTQGLRARQKANDAFQDALRAYRAAYRNTGVPTASAAVPGRLLLWCRVLRTVFHRAGACPPAVLAEVYRVAERTAEKVGREPVARASDAGQLDAVIEWCQSLQTAAA